MSDRGALHAAIQPVGCHLGVSSDWQVTACSANVADFLPTSAKEMLGAPLTASFAEHAIHDIRNRMSLLRSDDSVEHLLGYRLIDQGGPFDISLYRDGDGFGIDIEAHSGASMGDAVGVIEGMLARIETGSDVDAKCDAIARQIRSLTGYDSVCVDLAGEAICHSARPGAPASRAPPAAASFMICDSKAASVPAMTVESGAASPVRSDLCAPGEGELQWAAACGARAVLVLPLTLGGEVNGHVSCLHATPRRIGLDRRGIARLFTAIASQLIEIAELRRDIGKDA